MAEPDLEKLNAGIARMLSERLGIAGHDLGAKRRRAGRMLPRRIARDLDYLDTQQMLAGHPKLRALVDPRQTDQAARRVTDWLQSVDPARRRTDRLLGLLAVIAFNLLLLAGLIVAVLAWRGVIGPG